MPEARNLFQITQLIGALLLLMVLLLTPLTAFAEHEPEPETVKVNILSAFSTTQERELVYSFRQTLADQYSLKLEEQLIFWQRQNNWQELLESNTPDLIIVIGNKSLKKIEQLDLNTPVLALMINKSQFEKLRKSPKASIYAISHSQPTERFVQLAKSLNVYQAQVGSFISPQTKHNIQEFEELAAFYDLSYSPVMVEPKLNGRDAMRQLSLCCSVIILESDCVFRPGKVRKSIMVNAYRERIIVIAHSESVLKEGAMLTLFTQPYDMGVQAANLYHALAEGSLTQPYQYPDKFAIAINRKIARLLGYDDLTVGGLMQKVETLDFIQSAMGNGKQKTP
ncbi:ABC transporter substrate-binding protein [Kangiella taiwanensis]|uniref:ABC transporter substrate-binding protein n=1 Tax=Kangiella taiwanensis TaxID=1079179 RepID=A0ABP8I1K0_9GAMM|nr:ABC transporter substrate-binding protein [Kangiella taiwanensis]